MGSKMGNGSWFAQLIQASNSFCIDERVSWIDIEGLPLKAWTKNTFNRITSKWGELLYLDEQVEGYFHSKRVCVKTKLVDNICESIKIIIQGKTYWVRAKEVTGWIPDFEDDNEDSSSSDEELSNDDVLDDNGYLNNDFKMEDDSDLEEVAETIFEQHEINADDKGDNSDNQVKSHSEDPFNIYDILKKKKESNPKYSEVEESMKYPPGFTPDIDIDAQINLPKGVEVEDVIHDSNENTEGASSGIKQNSGPNNTKVGSEKSVCSGHFKKDFVSKSGGLAQKAKKDWVRELCDKHKVSFLSLQETKMENIDQFNIKLCWGNYGFDSSISPFSGEFRRDSLYIRDKKLLWEYLSLVISNWKGDVIVMGDFNEVRSPNERYESVFNSQGANIFNQFISSAGLEELPLGGCKYTWCHKTGTKMSKLDRFLVFDGLWRCYPDMSSIMLDRFLSDHRPILMRESHHDYGPTSFRFYHYWFDLEGFDKFVEETWMNAPQDDTNAMHSIRGILVDGNWIETPSLVKKELLSHFSNRFDRPPEFRLHNNAEFPNKLSPEQQSDLEINLFLENDVIEAVNTFFINGNFPKGINSSFITLIPKNQEAKTTKDFRPITLIGCIYKIISKILANRIELVLEDLVNKVQSAFISKRQILNDPFILNELYHWCSKKKKRTMIFKVDFEKAYDSVRWDYLDDILRKFGFGEKWCSWIRNCLISSKVMESLHISISRVLEAGLFRGVQVGNDTQVSHLFFADDAVFMGHWSDSNIDIIIRILDCFYHASGLKINMSKSKLLGISVHRENVAQAAQKIGCDILQTPFSYLGSKVGGLMSRVQSWDEIINIIVARLSRWKMQTLSIGGRFTL
ncbi:RNA-directed DNA polymerase, eukaryota, partial [Tanacetum coccineum]